MAAAVGCWDTTSVGVATMWVSSSSTMEEEDEDDDDSGKTWRTFSTIFRIISDVDRIPTS